MPRSRFGFRKTDLIEGYTLKLRERETEVGTEREKKMETHLDPVLDVLKDKIKPKMDKARRVLVNPGEMGLTDDPK